MITVPAKSAEDSITSVADGAACGKYPKNQLNELYSCNYYRIFRLEVENHAEFLQAYPFLNMTVTEGDGIINGQPVKKGDHMILPHGFGNVELSGSMEIIASTVPVE